MSNEIKVALLAIAAIALSYWGFKFIIGKNVLKNSNIYYVEYQDIDLMKTSSPVTIGGVQVGFVSEIEPLLDRKMVLVTLDLEQNVRIPESTVAYIKSTGFMGGKAIELRYGDPCSGDDCAESGDYLQGVTLGMISSMLSQEELNEYLNILENSIGSIVDSLSTHLLGEDADGPLANSLRSLESTMSNLESASGQLNGILYKSSDNINGTLANLESITTNLDSSNDQITRIIDQTEQFSGQLASVDLAATLKEVETTISELRSTLDKADDSFAGISNLVDNLEAGEGTLGLLLQDDGLYRELTRLSNKTDSLVTDFQERPYRYMPLKSRRKVLRYDRKDENQEGNE